MNPFPWLTTLGAVPLLGAVVVASLPRGRETLAKQLALAVSLVVLLLTIAMALDFDAAGDRFQFEETHSWIPSFGASYALGVDGIALVLIAMAVILTPICILASWHDAKQPGLGTTVSANAAAAETAATQGSGATGATATATTTATATATSEFDAPLARAPRARREQTFFALLLVLETTIIGVFAATDVFLFYVFFEAMLIPVYFLIGSYGGPQRSYAAVKFLLYSLFGGLVMLAAVIGLYLAGPGGESGFLFSELRGYALDPGTQKWLFVGFFIAFAIKAPLWPAHTWLPDAAAESPSGAAVLLVGVLDKVGTFGMLRYCLELFPDASRWATPVVLVLAVIGILYGALLAIGQTDLRRFIAYTSISHFGFIALGIFAFTSTAQSGATLYMVNHGFATGMLFLIAGMLIARRGSRRIEDYRGVARVAPLLAGSFLIAVLAALSLPGLATFISEFTVLVGTYQRYPVAAVVATLGIILAAVYALLLYQRMMTGPADGGTDRGGAMHDLGAREAWVLAPLIALLIAIGFFPKPVLDVVNPAVKATMESAQRNDPDTKIVVEPVSDSPSSAEGDAHSEGGRP